MLTFRHCEAAKRPWQPRGARNRPWVATGLAALAMTKVGEG